MADLNRDRELLSRIGEGDAVAFGDYVRTYTDSLYSYILKITKSEPWAEELVQDVWLQVWLARKEFAVLENPVAYLHRMGQYRSIDWIRRNKRELKLQYAIRQQTDNYTENPISQKADFENTRQVLI